MHGEVAFVHAFIGSLVLILGGLGFVIAGITLAIRLRRKGV